MIACERTKHICIWLGCATAIEPKYLMCREHWFRLPREIRDRIWGAYRPGEPVSRSYAEAVIAARKWIFEQTGERSGLELFNQLKGGD